MNHPYSGAASYIYANEHPYTPVDPRPKDPYGGLPSFVPVSHDRPVIRVHDIHFYSLQSPSSGASSPRRSHDSGWSTEGTYTRTQRPQLDRRGLSSFSVPSHPAPHPHLAPVPTTHRPLHRTRLRLPTDALGLSSGVYSPAAESRDCAHTCGLDGIHPPAGALRFVAWAQPRTGAEDRADADDAVRARRRPAQPAPVCIRAVVASGDGADVVAEEGPGALQGASSCNYTTEGWNTKALYRSILHSSSTVKKICIPVGSSTVQKIGIPVDSTFGRSWHPSISSSPGFFSSQGIHLP
ncbi:hypothetical protein B0H14DRAFT_80514 [Mycena olivaceomarginata]|nr:hypothetical protein B0H14DRAFT_80514 [Mycena olivaceomarginata]